MTLPFQKMAAPSSTRSKNMAVSWLSSAARVERWGGFQRWAVLIAQCCIFVFAGLAAFLLRFDFSVPDNHKDHLVWGLLIWLPVKLLVFRVLDLDRGWWRFVSVYDLGRLAVGNVAASTISGLALYVLSPDGFPRSVYLLDLALCFLATSGIRAGVKIFLDSVGQRAEYAVGKRIFIYGAGAAGVTLLREIRSNPKLKYAVSGFIDDNPQKSGATIQGVRVLGDGSQLPGLVARHSVSEVLIAMPSASGTQMTAILERCHEAGVRCRTIPALAEVIENTGLASQIRDVAVDDLLGRTPIRLDDAHIRAKLQHSTVLVTGAAGSIGSELCRQIARFRPGAIVGFDIAETALFCLDREMREKFPDILFVPEVGSVQNKDRLATLLARHRPSALYHAAAYKHVPLMEDHPFEAIENNVFGTFHAACAAAEHHVQDFVMISTDKAVRPTSIMGVSKRIAELVVRSMQSESTNFVSVRFGNVLGSNGSVIPIFKSQIAAGGPVTVTHPEMRRYFMTIPEAAQLVLQAAAMSGGGEIFVLDMGQPVKIVDLATNLILLSGLRPGKDIQLQFTGIRPGEKLYEELNTMEEDTISTGHEKIKIFSGNGFPEKGMSAHLGRLSTLCRSQDLPGLVLELKQLVPEYNPSAELLQRILAPAITVGETTTADAQVASVSARELNGYRTRAVPRRPRLAAL